jgi:Sulfotransferase family
MGRQIVERAFREAWPDLLTVCPKNGTVDPRRTEQDYLRGCIVKMIELGNQASNNTPHGSNNHSNNLSSSSSWPWWIRTLYRDMAEKRNGLAGRWHMLQFGNPRLRLCVYEKGGTKHWKKLQCRHNHLFVQKLVDEPIPDFNQCFNRQPPYDTYYTNKRPSNYNSSIRSARVVFLRDPLDRFLSGFLDKCVRRMDHVDHCEPELVFSNEDDDDSDSTSPVRDLLKDRKLFFKMYADVMPLQWNMHFFPQAVQCGGLYRELHEYEFVGSMGHNFYGDLRRLSDQYPDLGGSIEATFNLSSRVNVTNPHHGVETNAAAQVLEYYTPGTVRRVLELYAIDYVLLNLSVPDWAEEMLLRG